MTNMYCKECPATGNDCGPWDDTSKFFKNILHVHKNHAGFQVGEPTNIESEATNFLNQNLDEWFHNLVFYCKGPEKSCLMKNKWINTV